MAVVQAQANGLAPSGLNNGDWVTTGNGMYQIVAPGTPGARFNPDSGYWSLKRTDVGESTSEYQAWLQQNAEKNTARSQEFAREQMNFQQESNAQAMAFSAAEAEKNRQWQERLSSSAHQREVLDLVRAGLNPILSANGGASTPSGAAASGYASSGAQGQVDMSLNQVIGGILTNAIQTDAQKSIAAMNNDTNKFLGMLQASVSQENALVSAKAVLGAAAAAASATKYASDNSLEAAIYQADKTYEDHENHPTNPVQAGASVLNKSKSWLEKWFNATNTYNAYGAGSFHTDFVQLGKDLKAALGADPNIHENTKKFVQERYNK